MPQIGFSTNEQIDRILTDLKTGFHVRTDVDAVLHALRLSHVLLRFADEDLVTLVDGQSTVCKLNISGNPFSRMLAPNKALRGRHRGERGFIVCNGPSVKAQDLLPLRDEVTLFVHSGYHHPDYDSIRPRYHCVAPAHFNHKLTRDDFVTWFHEMQGRIGPAELFLNAADEPIAREAGLTEGRTIHYLDLRGPMEPAPDRRLFDLTETIPEIQSVPIMCLMIMMYLGFKEIYLVGVEHSDWKSGSYKYFYEKSALDGKDESLDDEGRPITKNYQTFATMLNLWSQYRVLGEIARVNGVRIVNATAGGELDEYERADLARILAMPRPIPASP